MKEIEATNNSPSSNVLLKVFEAFAGVGSQTEALKRLGIKHDVVAISEIDKNAIKSYEAIHGKVKNLGDISKVKSEDVPDHDLLTYSFPCQDISLSGKQCGFSEGSGTRSGLLWECQKVISAKKPKYLLLENVKNLVSNKHKANFDKWLDWLSSIGYTNYWEVLNAKDYGIPQNRERVFVVSILGEHKPFKFPQPIMLSNCLADFIESEVDEKFYLTAEQQSKFNPINLEVVTCSMDPTQGAIINDRILVKNATKLGYLEACEGDGIDLAYPNSKTRRGRVQKQCIHTLQTADSLGVLVDTRIRKLIPLEYWRLMGFSDKSFFKAQEVSSNRQLYKQAGNSIVVNVLEAIFAELFKEEEYEAYD